MLRTYNTHTFSVCFYFHFISWELSLQQAHTESNKMSATNTAYSITCLLYIHTYSHKEVQCVTDYLRFLLLRLLFTHQSYNPLVCFHRYL